MARIGKISVTNTKINEWEELTFNFAGKIGEGVSGGSNYCISRFYSRRNNKIGESCMLCG
jgi:hypothetical protein